MRCSGKLPISFSNFISVITITTQSKTTYNTIKHDHIKHNTNPRNSTQNHATQHNETTKSTKGHTTQHHNTTAHNTTQDNRHHIKHFTQHKKRNVTRPIVTKLRGTPHNQNTTSLSSTKQGIAPFYRHLTTPEQDAIQHV